LQQAHATNKPIYVTAFNRDGSRLATGGADEVVQVWDAASGSLKSTMQGHGFVIISADFNASGDRLLTVAMNERPKLWDVESGRELVTLNPFPGKRERLIGGRFIEDSHKAVFAAITGQVAILEAFPAKTDQWGCESDDFRHCVEWRKRQSRYNPRATLGDIQWE
jgi:WD40 repeat protein